MLKLCCAKEKCASWSSVRNLKNIRQEWKANYMKMEEQISRSIYAESVVCKGQMCDFTICPKNNQIPAEMETKAMEMIKKHTSFN